MCALLTWTLLLYAHCNYEIDYAVRNTLIPSPLSLLGNCALVLSLATVPLVFPILYRAMSLTSYWLSIHTWKCHTSTLVRRSNATMESPLEFCPHTSLLSVWHAKLNHGDPLPHVLLTADKAYRDMKIMKRSQSIVVSGKSCDSHMYVVHQW